MNLTIENNASITPRARHAEVENAWRNEISAGRRFRFGRNWTRFLRDLDEAKIGQAEDYLKEWYGSGLSGKTFLDVGCGSGLFSLAARRLGAQVCSFDFDPDSVACAHELRKRYFSEDVDWQVRQGSALDRNFIESLGRYDVVYSFGVLHHTGNLLLALQHAAIPVKAGGLLHIAIYNDQGRRSVQWRAIKKFYNSNPLAKALIICTLTPAQLAWGAVADVMRLQNPLKRYVGYGSARGMSWLTDRLDWLGGYPFEVARPEAILDLYLNYCFKLIKLRTVGGGRANNEFLFLRESASK